MELVTEQWIWLLLGALMVGLGKSGVPGCGNIAVALFAMVLPARESVGIILLVLIAADVVAVRIYRRHADWPQLWRLFPPAILGIVAGYFALDYLGNEDIKRVIAVILLLAVAHTVWKMLLALRGQQQKDPPRYLAPVIGVAAGLTTMIANAAGPIMQLYLLAMRLPKMVFIGTGAWYFLLMNVFKVPFAVGQNMITSDNVWLSLTLMPMAIIGGLIGPAIVKRISQRWFEILVLVFILITAVLLLVR